MSSAQSLNVLLIFDIDDLKGVIFLNLSFFFFFLLALLVSVTLILPFRTIYASLYSHRSDLSLGVLNLILL